MALILCSECGQTISDKAQSCPHCGCPVEPPIQSGVLHFHWIGRRGDSIRKTVLTIDGAEVCVFRCGDGTDLPVTPGTYKVGLSQKKRLLLEETVTINGYNPEEYFAFREVWGFSHPNLIRVDASESNRWNLPNKNAPRCPTCGSDKIKKLSLTRKVVSFEVAGFASGSVGKTFECKKCGYKW